MAQQHVPAQAGSGAFGAGVVAAAGNQFPGTSLYVGDLEASITESQLVDLFGQIGQVVSVRVCRDVNTRRSLGYAYVNFANPLEAARALEMLNFTPVNGKPIRIMYSNRDPSIRKSGAANIFIKNLDKSIDNKALHDTFSAFGSVLSCKVAIDPYGQSKGYGYVQFEEEDAARNAIAKLNGMLINDSPVYVEPFLRKQERESYVDKLKFTNVFVKNLSESTTKEDLDQIFGKYGNITSSVVMTEGDGKSKCFGFVNFEDPDAAALAVQELNGQKFDDREWYVGKAQKKSEREQELKGRFVQSAKDSVVRNQDLNLYLKNLDGSIGNDLLKDLFSPYGNITSCKVMQDTNGISRGFGFVAFSTPEEAASALLEMNGKMVSGKPLYVAIAQPKEERRARLQARFSLMRPVAMAPASPRIPMYPGAPAISQQIFYGQAPPAFIPPQPGFGIQQQLVPGMRPGGSPMPNYYMPLVQQGQQIQHPGGRRAGAGPIQQTQQPMPLMQQQILPRGRAYHNPPGHTIHDVPMSGVSREMFSPYDMGGMPMRDAVMPQPTSIGTLISALANANPDQQRMMLGESLYPMVEQLEPDHAAKVTGMLLEMDQTEVVHLLESPDALSAKIGEAMDVLRKVAQHQQPNAPSDQLAALSLTDGLVS